MAGTGGPDTVGDPGSRFPADGHPVSHVGVGLWYRWRHGVQFCLLAMLFVVTSTPGMINDTRAAAAAAWNLGTNATLDFAVVGFDDVPWSVVGVDGSLYTDRFPGAFLPAVPLYALVQDTDVDPTNPASIPLQPAGVTAALLVAAAAVVLTKVLEEVVDARTAMLASLVAVLATPVWSVAARALWTHTVGVLVLALAMLALARQRWWLAGTALGWAVLTRPTHAVTAAVIGLLVAWPRRSWRVLFAIALPSLAGLAVLSGYSRVLFGTWLPVAGYDAGRVTAVLGAEPALLGEYTWFEQVWGTFFDTYHGVVPYSLFLVPLAVGLVAGWRVAPDWARACMVAGVAYWLAQLRGNRFTGGAQFVGYRFPIEPLWLMVPVLVLGWVAVRGRSVVLRRITQGAVVASLVAMAVLVAATPLGVRAEPGQPIPPLVELDRAGTDR